MLRNQVLTRRVPILNLYRRLLALRRELPALHAGAIDHIEANSGVLSFQRFLETQHLQNLLNLTNELQQVAAQEGTVLLTTILDGEGGKVGGPLFLEAGEGLIIALTGAP